MADSVFTKIIKGEISSTKVYEDEHTYAFLDHNPRIPGHTLVIPKKQVAYVWDLEDRDYQALMSSVKKVANRIKEVLGPRYVGMQVEGIAVAHAHVHVFPFNNSQEYHMLPVSGANMSEDELSAMGEKLRF